ncbi:hypothetical protein ABZV93_20910 [Actinopolymorpha sp. NPDC004070]|uniref:hypothetical protein n=1 Tax=Actinopolymorpha sp. NPDC004070 TaxID=3154548 RepID=UPI0033BDC46D
MTDDLALTSAPPADGWRLPTGTRLLHIGPHKTGTTAVQAALFEIREELAGRGIYYPSYDRHPMHAVLAVTGRHSMMGDDPPKQRHWDRLLNDMLVSEAQTGVISSEFFSEAGPEAIARIVEDVGGERVHVVVTLRPLVKILPSQWQQYVQNGQRTTYENWLHHMLRVPPYEEPNPSFWRRHRHDRLIERWVDVVGRDRVTVVVVDDSERDMVLRVFESLLGLPDGTLPAVPVATNRSLSLGEIEMLRRFNVEFRSQDDLPDNFYSRLVRYGAIQRLKEARQPGPDEPRVTTPRWAQEEAVAIGREIANWIAGSGVRVIGDLDLLHTQLADAAEEPTTAALVDAEAAAQALFGAIAAVPTLNPVLPPAPPVVKPQKVGVPVHKVRSTELVRILGRRARRRLLRRRGRSAGS